PQPNEVSDTEPIPNTQLTKLVWLRPQEHKMREDKLHEWRRTKWSSPECLEMNITESYILSDKAIVAFARHPNIVSVADLKTATTIWPHYEHWGQEIVDILWSEQRQREEEKNRAAIAKEVNKAQRAQEKVERKQQKQEAKRKRAVAGAGPSTQGKTREQSTKIEDVGESSTQVGRCIKEEILDEVIPRELEDERPSTSNRQGQGKNQSNAPLTQSQMLEQLAIRLPKAKKPRLDSS
ncbi:hypothetical protein FRC11_012136, partial [Ceratobasidium sp. 423]